MGILVGFHCEGHDYRILRAYLAKLMTISEAEIEADVTGGAGGTGWQSVLQNIPKALKRFYGKCAQLAVIGLDNDGNADLLSTGAPEDASLPRH
jgi:hypothetical protein